MEYTSIIGNPAEQDTPCVVAGIYESGDLTPAAAALDKASDGRVAKLVGAGEISGKTGSTLLLHELAGTRSERVLLVGLGKREKLGLKAFTTACGQAAKALDEGAPEAGVSYLPEVEVPGHSLADRVRLAVLASEDKLYRFNEFKSQAEPPAHPLSRLAMAVTEGGSQGTIASAAAYGAAIGRGMRLAKDVANRPGNVCTPTHLGEQAEALAERYDSLSAEVLDEEAMEELGMGALLAVAKGSAEPGRLIVLQHHGAKDRDAKPVTLVGKGVTFDTGGISLKPGAAMDEMKYDMGGAAGVLGTIAACAEMELPLNVVAVIPSVENMPSDRATKPGDIVKSMSGQTIEILNTDAEGRLILCDALSYAERFEPDTVIDIATLTGACIVALGSHAAGLLSNQPSLAHDLLQAGEAASDRAWQLPLWDDYQSQLDSNFADMANIGGREAGTITAACFLSRFTKKYHWAHLDIAGVAWKQGKEKGATGRPVPLLTQYLIDRCEE